MPSVYLEAGNGRIFYMLKTFTLKVFDVFRNEVFHKIRTGNKAEKIQGLKNLIRLSVGLEDVGDLVKDLAQALGQI